MHNISGDRENAMCNIQNRTIPAAQLANYRKLSIINFLRYWFSRYYSNANCLQRCSKDNGVEFLGNVTFNTNPAKHNG
jgi:hypothetical protein